MTTKEKITVLRALQDKAYGVLARMAGPDALVPMDTARTALEVVQLTEHISYSLSCELAGAAPRTAQEAPVASAPAPEPDPVPQDDLPLVEPAAPSASVLTLEKVRGQLADLVAHGAPVGVLLHDMGCERLSQVPQERYAELLDKARAAAGKG